MNISQEKIDALNTLVKIKVEPSDYKESVEKKLKEYRKNARIPGFRPGNVPMGVVKKMAWKGTLVEEVNKILSNSIYKYIMDNKLDILGNPLPKEESDKDIDWENQQDFEFTYELGLAPEFDVELSDKLKFERYTVKIDDKLTNQYITDIAKQYGKMSNPDTAKEDDILFGNFQELDGKGNPLESGIENSGSLFTEAVTDKKLKKGFIGAKSGDQFVIKLSQFKPDTNFERMLGIPPHVALKNKSKFSFTLDKVNRLEPTEVNQELFDKIYGPGVVQNEAEFKAKVAEEIGKRFETTTDQKLQADIQVKLMEKLKLSLPDAFLKKWLKQANEKPITDEDIEKEYEQYTKGLKWQLIENKIIEKYNQKVGEEELKEHVRLLLRQQFANMGQEGIDDEILEDTVNRVLQNQEEVNRINDQIYSTKLLNLFKEKLKIKEKQVSYDEFVKLAQR